MSVVTSVRACGCAWVDLGLECYRLGERVAAKEDSLNTLRYCAVSRFCCWSSSSMSRMSAIEVSSQAVSLDLPPSDDVFLGGAVDGRILIALPSSHCPPLFSSTLSSFFDLPTEVNGRTRLVVPLSTAPSHSNLSFCGRDKLAKWTQQCLSFFNSASCF